MGTVSPGRESRGTLSTKKMQPAVVFRVMLKKIMNIKDNLFFDIIIACCCPCLSICQQGAAVDHAMGYEVVGCCDIEWRSSSDHSDSSDGNNRSIGAAANSPSA